MHIRPTVAIRRSTLVLVIVATVTGAGAQVPDQLRCYKIKDPLKLKGVADFNSQQLGLEPGCTLKRGAFFCVPGTATVVEATADGAPVPLLPVHGSGLADNRICYKFKCDGTPAPQPVTDQFGARTVEPKGVGLVCMPALNGLVNPECSNAADCDDGDPCNGFEQCGVDYQCQPGTPIGCQAGDIVFVAPFQAAAQPTAQEVAVSPEVQNLDVYLLLDRSGSMSTEIVSIKNNASTVVSNLSCPPFGTGTPGQCIPSLWAGAGTIGYAGGAGSYNNWVDLQPNPNFSGVPTTEPAGCCSEAHLLATWSTVTGSGSAASGCTITSDYAARASCTGSPAGSSGVGYPCFRPDSLPVIVMATDESFSTSLNCPVISVTAAAANAISARVVGLVGSGSAAQVRTELEDLATQTGAIDASSTPFVLDGADAAAAAALQTAISDIRLSPIDTRAVLVDDSSDAVDTVAAFLERVETLQLGTAECTGSLTDQDSNADGFDDEYAFLAQQSPVCWRIRAKTNATVAAIAAPQVFPATIQVQGARRAGMGQRRVLFVVPPAP